MSDDIRNTRQIRTLYLLATPIGNLEDISARALRLLKTARLIAAEDTRVARRLLATLDIRPPSVLLSLRAHNEVKMTEKLCATIGDGEHAVYIADAGTPGISDPGGRLAQTARQLGLAVVAVPGASALTTLIAVAGVTDDGGGVHFFGFPPRKQQRKFFLSLRRLSGHVVLFESPHRIAATLAMLAEILGEECRAVLGRELTKLYEQVVDSTLGGLVGAMAAEEILPRGEFALLIKTPAVEGVIIDAPQLFKALREHLPPRRAATLTATLTGADKNALYDIHNAERKTAADDE